jgi:EmrB/QacA subfamily drug resistance transporter
MGAVRTQSLPAAPAPAKPAPVALPPGVKPVVAALMLCMFLVALDGTIVSPAMPRIAGDLGGFSLYAWVPSIYLLTTAVTTPIYGKLADLFGRKRVLYTGIGLFLLGSVLSGAAPNMLALILFRAIQGLGAGAVQPVTLTIVGDLFTVEQRARVQGAFSSVWGVSSVIGPLLGGVMVDNVGWRWIFYLNLPVGMLATIMIARFFHERATANRHSLDIAGASLLTAGLSAVLLLLIEGGQAWPWLSAPTLALAVLTIAALLGFLLVEQRAVEPVFPLDLFRNRIIAVSSIAMCFGGVLMIAVTFELPLFVQGVQGQDALHGGMVLIPMTVGWPVAGTFSGRLSLRFGYRTIAVTGLLSCLLGIALLLTLTATTSFVVASLYGLPVGVGLGLSSIPLLIAVQSAVTWARRGVATATNMFVRTFGSVVGLAILGALINNATQGLAGVANRVLAGQTPRGLPAGTLQRLHTGLLSGIHAAFTATLIAAVLGLIAVLFLPGGSARDHVAQEGMAGQGH